jgi:hypothetical protein
MLRKGLIGLGIISVLVAVCSELAFRYLPRKVNQIITDSVEREVVWAADAPASTWSTSLHLESISLVVSYSLARLNSITPSAGRYEGDNHTGDPPDYIRFYFLNITNVKGVRSGDKPILVSLLCLG